MSDRANRRSTMKVWFGNCSARLQPWRAPQLTERLAHTARVGSQAAGFSVNGAMMPVDSNLLRVLAVLASIFVIFSSSISHAFADKRVALIIGNGAYENAPHLPNPSHDAQDVADALKRSGFETILGVDLNKAAMDAAAIRFARAAREADVAMFYYSGHAMQYGGVNYLAPVDARLTDEADLRLLERLDDIVTDLQRAKNLRILVLDACRDNPLAEDLKRSIGMTRAMSVQRGLAKIDNPEGLIIAYATQAGRTAEDGSGRNSPYTSAFLKHIETPDEIGTVFRKISADVYTQTKQTQLPELSLSLIGEFYLRGRADAGTSTQAGIGAASSEAAQAWSATKDTTSEAVLEDFVRQFGSTIYGSLAKARLQELKSATRQAGPPKSLMPTEALVPETIPFIQDSEQAFVRREYLSAPDHKAIAISSSRMGFITGQSDDQAAKTIALANCQKNSDALGPGRVCELYAVGNVVVSTRGHPPMPPKPWVVHDPVVERSFDAKDAPMINNKARSVVDSYGAVRGRKALALSPLGSATWYSASSDEVIRRSLEWCGINAGVPCMALAVDDVFVVPIPTTMKAVGFFRPNDMSAIAPEKHEQFERRISGATRGWSAVAVGARGQPGVAVNAATEQDAIEKALTDCGSQDRSCRVIAIGPFLVEAKSPPEPTAASNR
jgi:uncharacterized caspase-like protein